MSRGTTTVNYLSRIYKRIERKMRSIWHDLYYAISGDKGADFAMTCEEASKYTDLGISKISIKQKVRYRIHISICQICKNYSEFTQILRSKIKRMQKDQKQKFSIREIEEMNKSLFADLTSKNQK